VPPQSFFQQWEHLGPSLHVLPHCSVLQEYMLQPWQHMGRRGGAAATLEKKSNASAARAAIRFMFSPPDWDAGRRQSSTAGDARMRGITPKQSAIRVFDG